MKTEYEKHIKEVCSSPHTVFFFEETDSTNLRAAEYIKSQKARGGEVFIAKTQSAGRGTRQRSFYSEGGLYMSLILKAEDMRENVTPFAAVCVCRAVDSLFGTDCKIKWVNDIILNGKKLCGILCESCFSSDGKAFGFIIIGIGINTNVASFPPKIEDIATSLYLNSGEKCDNASLAAAILYNLERGTVGFMNEYRERSALIGKMVEVTSADGRKKIGKALAIDNDGALLLENASGTERIVHGDVFAI